MGTAEYERVLGELHRILIEPGSQVANLGRRGETYGGVRVKRAYLDEPGPAHEIARSCSGTSNVRIACSGTG